MGLIAILGPIVFNLIEHWFTDSAKIATAKAELQQALDIAAKMYEQTEQAAVLENSTNAQANIILADKNGNVLQRDWIPVLMYLCIFIIASAMIFTPILHFFFNSVGVMEVPDHVWSLIEICVGGCVGVHGVNKLANTVFNNDSFFQSLKNRMGRLSQQQVDALNSAISDAEKQ